MEPTSVSTGTSPIMSVVHTRETLCTWMHNDYTINLVKYDGQLECEVVNTIYNDVRIHPMPIPPRNTLDHYVARFKACRVVKVNQDGSPTFALKYQTWNSGTKDIHLLKGVNDLTWSVFCRETRRE